MIAPRENLDTQFILKIGNLAEKRWLSDVQLLCRMSEIFLSGGRQKYPSTRNSIFILPKTIISHLPHRKQLCLRTSYTFPM